MVEFHSCHSLTGLPLDALVAALGADGRLVHVERLPGPGRGRWPSWPARCRRSCAGRCGSTRCGRTRPRPSTWPAPGARWPWPPGRRRASRSATRRRSPRRSADPVRPGTALLIFPTKALAQDQLRALQRPRPPRPRAGRLRRRLLDRGAPVGAPHANVVLTNPEMLHCGLLPHHGRWATFLLRLRYVVRRRAARVPGRLRHPRRPRAAPAAAGVPRSTAATRPSSSARPPSATPPGWRRRCGAGRSRPWSTTARRGASGWSRCGSPTPPTRPASSAPARRPRCWPSSSASGHRAIAFCRSRRGHRGRGRRRPAPPARRPGRRPSAPTAAATCRPSAGRSRRSCSPASCGASSPPTPSSSASTSAGSTPACSTASPARSPRSGSRRAGPGASASSRSPCSSPARTSSTSGSCATPTSCSPARRSRR